LNYVWLARFTGLWFAGFSRKYMTMKSPTDEIREIRHKLAAKFDNDLNRICEDLMRQQRESGRKYIRLSRRVPKGYQGAVPPVAGEEQVVTPPPSSTAGSEG
jgi:hypothetical protein